MRNIWNKIPHPNKCMCPCLRRDVCDQIRHNGYSMKISLGVSVEVSKSGILNLYRGIFYVLDLDTSALY